MKDKKKGPGKRQVLIGILLLLGFCAVEFPGILLVKNRVYPFLFGMPFLYGYVVCCWLYFCCVLFYAYRTRWGRKPFISKGTD